MVARATTGKPERGRDPRLVGIRSRCFLALESCAHTAGCTHTHRDSLSMSLSRFHIVLNTEAHVPSLYQSPLVWPGASITAEPRRHRRQSAVSKRRSSKTRAIPWYRARASGLWCAGPQHSLSGAHRSTTELNLLEPRALRAPTAKRHPARIVPTSGPLPLPTPLPL